jgi:hypothetical protein
MVVDQIIKSEKIFEGWDCVRWTMQRIGAVDHATRRCRPKANNHQREPFPLIR